MVDEQKTIGIVGARGYVAAELVTLIGEHPALDLRFISSRERHGQPLRKHHDNYTDTLCYQKLDPDAVIHNKVDVVVLALPNGHATPYVEAIERDAANTIILDLSADHRFDKRWYYGLPELTRKQWRGERRISNPGCYATAIQLSIAPLKDLLAAPPVCFGISGYSGAGGTPSDKNDPQKLRDNLMPYTLTGHVHEKEASFQLGLPVEFMPHVAPHFRGLSVTSNLYLSRAIKREAVVARFQQFYETEPLVQVLDETPWVSRVAYQHHADIGGFALSSDQRRVVVVAALDNLLKGAATQAMQNINLVLGMNEYTTMMLQQQP